MNSRYTKYSDVCYVRVVRQLHVIKTGAPFYKDPVNDELARTMKNYRGIERLMVDI
jgi:hypothetical protein